MDFDFKNLLLNDILVPEVFISEYLPVLSGEASKLYLIYLMQSNKNNQISIVESARYISRDKKFINKLINELVINGLIKKDNNDHYQLIDLKKVECLRCLETIQGQNISNDSININLQSEEDKLINDINNTFLSGMMGFKWTHLILQCIREYEFDNEVIYTLFSESSRLSELSLPYTTSVANTWYKAGIKNIKDLEAYFNRFDEYIQFLNSAKKSLKIHFTDYHEQMIKKWLVEDKISEDLIIRAFETSVNRSYVDFKYFDELLKSWCSKGLDTRAKVDSYYQDKKEHKVSNKHITNSNNRSFPKYRQRGGASMNFRNRDFTEEDFEEFERQADSLPKLKKRMSDN